MIKWRSPNVFALWEWIEANCPATTINGIGRKADQNFIYLQFGSDDEEILFRMRWTMPGSEQVR